MNFLEELQNLDFNDIGRWPLTLSGTFRRPVLRHYCQRAVFITWFIPRRCRDLNKPSRKRRNCARQFEEKQKKAVNFDAYKEQLAEIERSFGTMLRQLPGKTEIPNLLIDISQTGLAAGLQEELFQPVAELAERFLCREADQDSSEGHVSRIRQVRQRPRGVAAYRDAA